VVNFIFMYVILVYDCGEKRVGKMLKLCRRYLTWIQNSVFEGEISEVNLLRLKTEARQVMDVSCDSLIIFSTNQQKRLYKEIVGVNKNEISDFL
jgi:CRISPR-associated protein Cas2